MYLDLISKVVLVIVNALGLVLGIGVYISDRKSKINIFYLATTISMLLWADLGYLVYESLNSYDSTIFGKLNFAMVSLFLVFSYGLLLNFPKKIKARTYDYIFIIIGVLLSSLCVFSDLILSKIDIIKGTLVWNEGPLGLYFYLYAVIALLIAFYRLFMAYRSGEPEYKNRIKYFSYGVFLFAIFNIIFNVIIPAFVHIDKLYWLGDYAVIFFIGYSAYAIVKYKLFNIKVITTETTVILISISLLIEVFMSSSIVEGAVIFLIWMVATYGGWVLIKSVKKEIQQREELQKLTAQLKDANEHLKEMDKLKDDFLSMASHELNTPITAIQGYLSMILEEHLAGEVNPTAKQYLTRVYESAKRLSALVKDLLNVSRIESGRIHIIYEEAQIEDLIEQAQAEVMPYVKNAGHKMTYEKPKKKMPTTWLDKTRITEVLINIMSNAVKYTEPPGLIEISVSNDNKFITVKIKDNGRGIPKDKQDTVFAKFSQIDVLKDQVKGTGLGMYISKKFIELQNGKIWFESTDGKGTTFIFTVPVLDKKPSDTHEGEGAILH